MNRREGQCIASFVSTTGQRQYSSVFRMIVDSESNTMGSLCSGSVQLLWLAWLLWWASMPVASQSYVTHSSAATLSGRARTYRRSVERNHHNNHENDTNNTLDDKSSSIASPISIPTHSSSSVPSSSRRRSRKRQKQEEEQRLNYERRRDEWMRKYGSLEALQATFGTSTRRGGDLTPEQTRRLYHALLPRSLWSLSESGLMRPDELAPLAFQARVAAKAYARSRSVWTGRIITSLFDQYRSLRDKGRFVSSEQSSVSWEELWNKYEAQIVQEECQAAMQHEEQQQEQQQSSSVSSSKPKDVSPQTPQSSEDDSLTMRIYLRILQKSCATNAAFDSLFLRNTTTATQDKVDLVAMGQKLERDVQEILLDPRQNARMRRQQAQTAKRDAKARAKEARLLAKLERKEEKARQKQQRKLEKQQRKQPTQATSEEFSSVLAKAPQSSSDPKGAGVMVLPAPHDDNPRLSSPRWEALRVLAGTRRMFRLLATSTSSSGRRKNTNARDTSCAEPLRGGGDSSQSSNSKQRRRSRKGKD